MGTDLRAIVVPGSPPRNRGRLKGFEKDVEKENIVAVERRDFDGCKERVCKTLLNSKWSFPRIRGVAVCNPRCLFRRDAYQARNWTPL